MANSKGNVSKIHDFAIDTQKSSTPNHVTMRSLLSCLSLAVLLSQAQALYFYIDGPTQKCFFEELPKDTLVVGMENVERDKLDAISNGCEQVTTRLHNGMIKHEAT